MKKHGVWQGITKPKYYPVYSWALTAAQMKDTRIDDKTGDIFKANAAGKVAKIGLMVDAKPRRGFDIPSRKFSVHHEDIEAAAKDRNFIEDGGKGMPEYFPVPGLAKMKPEQLHLTTFKWNVHTQRRTQSQKFLTEIVHHNPMWINTKTATERGLKTCDWVEITMYRPHDPPMGPVADGVLGTAVIPVWITADIRPRVLAMSNTLGNLFHGRAATASNGPRQNIPAFADNGIAEDQDVRDDIWGDPTNGGTATGYNINAILAMQLAPLVDMQGWHDTVCSIRKI